MLEISKNSHPETNWYFIGVRWRIQGKIPLAIPVLKCPMESSVWQMLRRYSHCVLSPKQRSWLNYLLLRPILALKTSPNDASLWEIISCNSCRIINFKWLSPRLTCLHFDWLLLYIWYCTEVWLFFIKLRERCAQKFLPNELSLGGRSLSDQDHRPGLTCLKSQKPPTLNWVTSR